MAKKAYTRGGRKGTTKGAPQKPDIFTNPEERGNHVYGAIYGARKALDVIAEDMAKKWGRNRLTTLVGPDMASKFHAVEERLNKAMDDGDAERVRHEAAILYRGYIALDQEADRLGKERCPSDVWEYEMEDGREFVVTYSDEDSRAVAAWRQDGAPDKTFVSLGELLRLYCSDHLAAVDAIKKSFPDATIGKPTLTKTEEVIDDDIPF